MKCPKCGAESVKGEKTCWQCYTPLDASAQSRQSATGPRQAVAPPVKRGSTSRLFAILAAVLVLAAAGGGYYYWSEYTGPKGCARAYCAAVQNRDQTAGYALLTEGSKRLVDGGTMPAIPPLPGGDKATLAIQEVTQTGDKAQAKVTASTGADASRTMTVTLMMVKESSGWRVDMMETMKALASAYGLPQGFMNRRGGR